jgi:hypothetical protein
MTEDYYEAKEFLKSEYGLEPGDVDLPLDATVVDVVEIAKKYDLTAKKTITQDVMANRATWSSKGYLGKNTTKTS